MAMYALHLIGKTPGPVFLGKGQADAEALRERLIQQEGGVRIHVSPKVGSAGEMNLRFVMACDTLRADCGLTPDDGWWPLDFDRMVLVVKASFLSMAHRPTFTPRAASIDLVRIGLGLDQASMAAMMGFSPAKMSRLIKGETDLSLEEFARLRWWCQRFGVLASFERLFPLDGKLAIARAAPLSAVSGVTGTSNG